MNRFATLLILAVLLISCDESGYTAIVGADEAAMTAFYDKYNSDLVRVTDAHTDHEGVTTIVFMDKNGIQSTAIFADAQWLITETEYDADDFMERIPYDVLKSYLYLAIDNADYSFDSHYIVKIERAGIDHAQYEFCFVAPYDDGVKQYENLLYHIIIDDTGEILTVDHGGFNRSFWWSDINASLLRLKELYPDAEILGSANDSGNMLYFIRDEGIIKEASFRKYYDWEWMDTRYELDSSIQLPESIQSSYEAYRLEEPDFIYNRVFYIESPEGDCYGLMMGTELDNKMIILRI